MIVRTGPRRRRLTDFGADQSGATAVEYGLLVACLTLLVIGAVGAAGTNIRGSFNKINNAIGPS